jgi:uncharacterized protein (TIGR00255 family)
MPYSMTGWGTYRTPKFTVNLRGLNSKYKEVVLHLPQEFFDAEPFIYRYLNDLVTRGRVDMYVNIEKSNLKKKVVVNEELFRETYASLKRLMTKMKIKGEIPIQSVLKSVEGIIMVKDTESADAFSWKKIKPSIEAAYSDFLKMKEKEAVGHIDDIEKRLAIIEKEAENIKAMYGEFKEEFITKTRERLETVLAKENRQGFLNTEAVEVLDKYNITEELVRIGSHVKQALGIIKTDAAGRKLDFLAQEFYREANTIGSKINHAKVAHAVIVIKENTEKIREQAMNLE